MKDENTPYLVPKISSKTKRQLERRERRRMFYNPFRKIRKLENRLRSKELKIKILQADIDSLKYPSQNHAPGAFCSGCDYLVYGATWENGWGYLQYHCKLDNHCKDRRDPSIDLVEGCKNEKW